MSLRGAFFTKLGSAWLLAAALSIACAAFSVSRTPWACLQANGWSDVQNHSNLIGGAAAALAEGQAPPREIPKVLFQDPPVFSRYAAFQFYSVLPHSLAGLCCLAGMLPYQSLVLWVGLWSLLGFWAAYFLAKVLRLGDGGSLACAIAFTLAPYHLIDWSSRAAFTELAAFAILPLTFALSFRCALRKGLGPIALSALSWAALIITHNIFHVWGLAFLLPSLLLEKYANRERPVDLLRPALAYLLGLALCAWFFAPVVLVGRKFSGLEFDPMVFSQFTTLRFLFTHVWIARAGGALINPQGYFQVGWVLLAAVPAWLILGKGKGWAAFGLLGFATAFFLVWAPYDVWRYLGPLKVAQFTFRILMFVTLFGAVLVGRVWDQVFERKATPALGLLLLLSAVLAWPYLEAGEDVLTAREDQQIQASQGAVIFQNYDYCFKEKDLWKAGSGSELADPEAGAWAFKDYAPGLRVLSLGGFPKSAHLTPGIRSRLQLSGLVEGSIVALPAPWYPGLYRIRVNGKAALPGRHGNQLAVRMPGGDCTVDYKLAGLAWANGLSLVAALVVALLGALALRQWRMQAGQTAA